MSAMVTPSLNTTSAIEDFGSCPRCGSDLNGPRIWQVLHDRHGIEKANQWAPGYGATRDHGRLSRIVASTGTPAGVPTTYPCPDCDEDVSEMLAKLGQSKP